MAANRFTMPSGTGQGIWPVLAILLVAVLVPAACVLWFMNAAMRNERLAVRQKLTEVYRQKMLTDQAEIAASWSSRTQLSRAASDPAEEFATLVRSGAASSVIVLDAAGRPAYPQAPLSEPPTPVTALSGWAAANDLEFAQHDEVRAAEAYGQCAAEAEQLGDSATHARAIQAQVRCLVRAGHTKQALEILFNSLAESDANAASVGLAGPIVANAQLLTLQLMPRDDPRFAPLARRLVEHVNRYKLSELPSSQRQFLMKALAELELPDVPFPTLAAEELAARYLEATQPKAEPLRVTLTALAGVWQMGSEDGRIVLLFQEDKLLGELAMACRLDEPFAGIVTRLELPGQLADNPEPFLTVPLSARFPSWRLAVYLEQDPFAASAEKAESLYLAAGISAIALIALLAILIASYFNRQIRLTRLKNDLIATVSHELKTPLASMRVLVDTLRAGRCPDTQQAGEYLELIAHEQERLSRLIDNFLTFSRMERNKRTFAFAAVDMADAVQAATASIQDRFSASSAQLELDLPSGLPQVRADRDALITVILNLLDNAWKYTGESKHVTVGASARDGKVFVVVRDNGIGLTRRTQRRIFDRFYQVDQTLARNAGGCGLGLSIVKFILDAHGGTIRVASQPGQGSTFTIELPALHESPAPIPTTSLNHITNGPRDLEHDHAG